AIWAAWRDRATDEWLESCAIVTTAAQDSIANLHGRRPVILPPGAHAEGLDPGNEDLDRLDRLFVPDSAGAMTARPVGRAVGNARNDGPQLIEPLAEPGPEGLPEQGVLAPWLPGPNGEE